MYISGPGELPHVNNLSEKDFYRLVVILILFSHSLLIARSGIDILIRYYFISNPLFPSFLHHHCHQILYTSSFLREDVFYVLFPSFFDGLTK